MSAETVLGHALGPKLGGAGTRRRPDPAIRHPMARNLWVSRKKEKGGSGGPHQDHSPGLNWQCHRSEGPNLPGWVWGQKKEGGAVDLKLFTPRIELGTFRVLGELLEGDC